MFVSTGAATGSDGFDVLSVFCSFTFVRDVVAVVVGRSCTRVVFVVIAFSVPSSHRCFFFEGEVMVDGNIEGFSKSNFKVVSKKKPNSQTLKNLIFAFNVCRYVKSNAIVLANNGSTLGIGSGQPSRLDSCKIAINKMKKFHKEKSNKEIVAASDAFFPFVDGVESLVQAGVSAIIQPSGSIRDKELSLIHISEPTRPY